MKPLQLPGISRLLEPVQVQRLQPHGADADAFSAAQANRILCSPVAVLQQTQHGICCFHNRYGKVTLGNAHHGPAADYPFRAVVQASGNLDQVMEAGTNPYDEILGFPDSLAGHGYNPGCHRHPQLHGTVNRREGRHIKHCAMRADRKLSRQDLPSRQCLNQLLFRALGITGGQNRQLDSCILRKESIHLGNRFLFVVLHRENCPLGLQNPAENLHPPAAPAPDLS